MLGAGLWALVGSMCFFPRIVSLFFPKVVHKKKTVKIASSNMTATTATSRNRPDKPDRPTDPILARQRQGSCLHFGSSITSWYDFNV